MTCNPKIITYMVIRLGVKTLTRSPPTGQLTCDGEPPSHLGRHRAVCYSSVARRPDSSINIQQSVGVKLEVASLHHRLLKPTAPGNLSWLRGVEMPHFVVLFYGTKDN
ncbi:hypothetical protein J6590_024871 [Homalodisca vitripennis]|nr:hypothetical protein J6590_024871 [Homalodisca vitripennis]